MKSILLSFLGLLLGLAAAETIVRVADPSYANGVRLFKYMDTERGRFCHYDATLGWDGNQDVEGEFEWIDCRFRVRQNRFGYRGTAYDFGRSGKPRILALGDSFVWGFGVDNEDMFTRVVEKESRVPREVINMGVSGYGTDQALLLWYQKAHSWKPDTVWLVANFLTDLYDNSGSNRYGYEKPRFHISAQDRLALANVPVPPRPQWSDPVKSVSAQQENRMADLLRHSALACLAVTALSQRPSWRAYLEEHQLILPMVTGYDWEGPMYQLPYEPDLEKLWTLFDRLVGELARQVEQAGGHLTLVLVPSTVQVYSELWEAFTKRIPLSPGKQWDRQAPTRRLAEVAKKNHLEVIDLLPDLEEAGKSDIHLYFPVNMHWTRSGHRVVANALLRHLQQKN